MDVETSSRIEVVARRCAEALAYRPAGVFSDFDGTLSEIAPTPDAAVPFAGAVEAFHRVARLVDVAGIITGRGVEDVRSKVDTDNLIIVGNHGLEWFEHGRHVDHEAGVAAEQAIAETLVAAQRRLAEDVPTTHMLWENKRLTASIHYRNVDDPIEVGLKLLPIVEEEATARGLRVSVGKMLVELRPAVTVSKGTALEQIIQSRGLASAIFFGDDVTDVDGFRSLHRYRDEQGLRSVAIAIRSEDVHPEVIAESDVVLESVADTVGVLERLAELLDEKGPSR